MKNRQSILEKRAFQFLLGVLVGVLLPSVDAAQAQNAKLLRSTTCGSERSKLEYGIWDEFKNHQIGMEVNGLMNVMEDVSERHQEVEAIGSYIETAQFISSIDGAENAKEVTKEIFKTAGLGAVEETFGLTGEAATTIYDAATSYSNPKDAVLFVANQSFSIGNDLVAIVEYGRRVPRLNTLIAFRQVMEANYRHCGNRQEITRDLDIGIPNEGFFFDNQDEFLTWAVKEWGEKYQNTDFFDFAGIDSGDNFYFYSSDAINDMVVEMRAEVNELATSFADHSAPETNPVVASVSPSSFVGQPVSQRQSIEITGTGFGQDATLRFYD